MKKRIGMLGVGIALLLGSGADAQIYSPPPPLQEYASFHLWSVPGVINDALGTVFPCTNTTSNPIIVGVEVFNAAGGAALNDADATSLALGPGATGMFGTQVMGGFQLDSNQNTGLVTKGSARILASAATGIICSAFLADPASSPPIAMTNLTLAKHSYPFLAGFACGLGSELVLVVPALFWLRERTRRRRV